MQRPHPAWPVSGVHSPPVASAVDRLLGQCPDTELPKPVTDDEIRAADMMITMAIPRLAPPDPVGKTFAEG
jgi:hypothetical protein